MQTTENTNECINWIEEAISKEYFRLYEYKYFSNVQKIGTGGFGKVYRANWKNSEQYLALKSFFNVDDVIAKEIVHEWTKKNKNSNQTCSFNEKCDIYSVGVLFWEISSGQPPFAAEEYDIDLALEISQGRREEPIPNAPENYIKIYTECWDIEPDNRPTINQVLERLKVVITKTKENHQTEFNLQSTSIDGHNFNPINIDTSNINNSLHGEMSQIIENVDKINTKEIVYISLTNEDISSEKKLNKIVNDIELKQVKMKRKRTVEDEKLAFEHYEKVANKAFELYQQAANLGHIISQNNLGVMYFNGDGVNKDYGRAFELYHKAANSGYKSAQYNLGNMYEYGKGIDKDINQAIYWYEKSAKQGNQYAQDKLEKLRKNN
ncbi:uncharacterized protein OCT59_007101 [Rhizophagus irregularis]|nr:hypothetical protein OCT59_007101 [Rhizophagus irregularis]